MKSSEIYVQVRSLFVVKHFEHKLCWSEMIEFFHETLQTVVVYSLSLYA